MVVLGYSASLASVDNAARLQTWPSTASCTVSSRAMRSRDGAY